MRNSQLQALLRYRFTFSTFFVNPPVTTVRSRTDTFVTINPDSLRDDRTFGVFGSNSRDIYGLIIV